MKSLENRLEIKRKIAFLLILVLGIMVSCDTVPEPEPEPVNQQAPAKTVAVNEFIEMVMKDVYLWYSTVPDIDYKYEFDSKAYFNKLLNEEDKWSWVTDDVKKMEDSFEGIETSYGWSLAFGKFSDTGTIFALVEFVYPDTPADKSGFKRGDMIFEMNGMDILESNYLDLLDSKSMSCTFGQYVAGGIDNVKTVSMTALELELDPVMITKIIEHEGSKIGYLFYAQFIGKYNSSLDKAFQYFSENQIDHLVLDVRYNPGGGTGAAQHLCSSLAPVSVVNDKSVLVSFQWNDKYQDYWLTQNRTDQLGIYFVDTVKYKMDLNQLYVITGQGTASAPELAIEGLKPYMTVKTVGETTYGKYTASITMKPEFFYDEPGSYKDFDNWAVQPIVLKYANSQGVTDFKDGIYPDIPVEDDLFSLFQLGDKRETMLKTAIEDMTGTEIMAATKSAELKRNYNIFDRGFSKFDGFKRDLILEDFQNPHFK